MSFWWTQTLSLIRGYITSRGVVVVRQMMSFDLLPVFWGLWKAIIFTMEVFYFPILMKAWWQLKKKASATIYSKEKMSENEDSSSLFLKWNCSVSLDNKNIQAENCFNVFDQMPVIKFIKQITFKAIKFKPIKFFFFWFCSAVWR